MLNDQTFSPTAIQKAGGVKTGGDRMSIVGVTIKALVLLANTHVFGIFGAGKRF